MDREIRVEWTEAFDNYLHGTKALRNDRDMFCAAGILCDLHRKATGGKWEGPTNGKYSYLGKYHQIPKQVLEWANLSNYAAEDIVWLNDRLVKGHMTEGGDILILGIDDLKAAIREL